MTFLAQLLRRSCQQYQAGGNPAELFDKQIIGTGRLFAPFQMMRFVDNHHIPTRRYGLLLAARVIGKKALTA